MGKINQYQSQKTQSANRVHRFGNVKDHSGYELSQWETLAEPVLWLIPACTYTLAPSQRRSDEFLSLRWVSSKLLCPYSHLQFFFNIPLFISEQRSIHAVNCAIIMMTSSNDDRVTGLLWGESTRHRWIPLTKPSDAKLWCFLWSAPGQTIETPVIWDAIALFIKSLKWSRLCVGTNSAPSRYPLQILFITSKTTENNNTQRNSFTMRLFTFKKSFWSDRSLCCSHFMGTWRSLLRLSPWCPIFLWSHCDLFENLVPYFCLVGCKWVAIDKDGRVVAPAITVTP